MPRRRRLHRTRALQPAHEGRLGPDESFIWRRGDFGAVRLRPLHGKLTKAVRARVLSVHRPHGFRMHTFAPHFGNPVPHINALRSSEVKPGNPTSPSSSLNSNLRSTRYKRIVR